MPLRWLLLVVCLFCVFFPGLGLRYSGLLKDKPKLVAPTFTSRGYQCSAGSGDPAEFDTFSFEVSNAPTAFFVRAMFDKTISNRASVRISSSSPTESNLCSGVLRGALSQSVAPHIQFAHWAPTNGTYFVTIHLTSALDDNDDKGLYAISLDEASAFANTATHSTLWFTPTESSGSCSEGEASPYAYAKWVPNTSGWFDANLILEHLQDETMQSTLSVWACTNANDLPGNAFSASSTFETCSANNSNSCSNIGIRQSSLSTFAYRSMAVNFGASTLIPRLSVNSGTTYYFMFGAQGPANSTGYAALILEKSRFETLQTTVLFDSPDPSEENCTNNIADQANAFFYMAKGSDDVAVLIDTGATDFDSIGSFYRGNNSVRESCPISWLATADLDENPVAITVTEEYDSVSLIVSPYSGTGSTGWLVQVWVMSGPAIPQSPSQSPSGSPTAPSTAPTSSPSSTPPETTPAIPISNPTSSPSGSSQLAISLTGIVLCVVGWLM